MADKHLTAPFGAGELAKLRAGDSVLISGVVYTARDAAHRRMAEALNLGHTLPVELAGQTIYYMGPSPARPGSIIGACGPTTSGRMDAYSPLLLSHGVNAMIGKGARSAEVRQAIVKYQAVYLVTYGGAGALLAGCIKQAEVVAYPELGAEAIMRLKIENFPALVADDIYGGDLFENEIPRYCWGTGG